MSIITETFAVDALYWQKKRDRLLHSYTIYIYMAYIAEQQKKR